MALKYSAFNFTPHSPSFGASRALPMLMPRPSFLCAAKMSFAFSWPRANIGTRHSARMDSCVVMWAIPLLERRKIFPITLVIPFRSENVICLFLAQSEHRNQAQRENGQLRCHVGDPLT